MPPPDDLDCLSHAELKGLVVKQWEQMVELQRLVAALRDEIARLKGGPGRPNLKPSGMERGTEPKPPGSCGERKRVRGSTRSKLAIHEERTVTLAPPRGSRFKGYTSFVVQDLMIRAHVVNFRCERWQTPDGDVMTAPLPAGINGHFGPELRRFVLCRDWRFAAKRSAAAFGSGFGRPVVSPLYSYENNTFAAARWRFRARQVE